MNWTDERLAALTPAARHQVWANAVAAGTKEGRELARRIEASGLSFLNPKGLELDSEIGRKLYRVIFSQKAKDAGATASEEGRPALADIEPLIVAELGTAYTKQKEATVQAGYLIGNMMENNGFRKTGLKKRMPPGSIAKTAECYVRRS
ncbi:MAG TPA: hypothetical protein VKB16_17210 [Beijerinckiaceae bacterium]|jgi:hypothetical protein|nr:hypothetical protein [Beijerinckiaceae bacterium]